MRYSSKLLLEEFDELVESTFGRGQENGNMLEMSTETMQCIVYSRFNHNNLATALWKTNYVSDIELMVICAQDGITRAEKYKAEQSRLEAQLEAKLETRKT